MKIGIAGPILSSPFLRYLNCQTENIPKGLGGTPIIQTVCGLIETGHQVSVYSLDTEVTTPVVYDGGRVRLYFGQYRERHKMRDFMKKEREYIRDFILEDDPDIVSAHWTYEFALGALAAKKPTVITAHDWAPTILKLQLDLYRVGRFMMNIVTLARGKHFIVNSPYLQKKFENILKRSVPVIPYALDDFIFSSKQKTLNCDNPKIISINNGFGKRKNVTSLFHAFQIIRKAIPSCELILLGLDFEKSGPANIWAKKHHLDEGVHFRGLVPYEQVFDVFDTGDLLIHSALEESFGMIFIEAMSRRVPVIGGKHSGAVPWVLDYGNAGILTDVTSPQHIAEDAIRILRNHDVWRRFSENGYTHASRNFRPSIIAERYLNQFDKVIAAYGAA